jgi:UDP-glucose 4-epimerase
MVDHERILVTGGAGFIGSWLVDELLARGHYVVCLDDLCGGFLKNVNKACKFIQLDLRETKKVARIVKDEEIGIIYHLAAYAAEGQSIFSPIEINDINVKPMNNLLVAAVNNNVKKFIFTSSMAVYGRQTPPFSEDLQGIPEDPYGVGKQYCERVLEIFSKIYGFDYAILRPHNVYGPRQNISDPYRNVLGIWINRIMRGHAPYIYGDGEQTRAFSYIEDVTPAVANAGFYPKAANTTINVGSDEVVSINEACRIVLDTMESDLEPIHVSERPGEVKHAFCTCEKSEALLDYRTNTKLRDGIRRMVDWAREVGPQKPTYRLPLEITKKAPKVWMEQLI